MNDYAAYYPPEDKSRQESENKEHHDAVASMPVIQQVLDWFDSEIATLHDAIALSDVDEATDAEELKSRIINNKKLAQAFEEKRAEFVTKFGPYLQGGADGA